MLELFLGAVVSLVVQVVKKYAGTTLIANLGAVLGLSLAAAGGLYYAQYAGFWPQFQEILTTAGAFYSFILRRFEDNK